MYRKLIMELAAISVCFLFFGFFGFQNRAECYEPYVNEQYGFEIEGPDGWIRSSKVFTDGNIEVVFRKEEKGAPPELVITTDSAGNSNTAFEYANGIIENLRISFASRQAEMKLLELPHEIEVNGIKGIRYVYEVIGPVKLKFIDCKFMKNTLVVSIMGSDYSTTFDERIGIFEKTIASFKFLKSKR